jgi:hypothetical protein
MRAGRCRPLPPAKREASQPRASGEEGSFAVAGLGRRGKLRILILGRRGPLSRVICAAVGVAGHFAASSDACRSTASGTLNSPSHAPGAPNHPCTWALSRPLGTSKNSRCTWALRTPRASGSQITPPPPTHLDAFDGSAWALSHVARTGNPKPPPTAHGRFRKWRAP